MNTILFGPQVLGATMEWLHVHAQFIDPPRLEKVVRCENSYLSRAPAGPSEHPRNESADGCFSESDVIRKKEAKPAGASAASAQAVQDGCCGRELPRK
jgi:hypothetical protein